MSFIEIKNLKKYFGTPNGVLHAVDNVSMNIERGTTMGIVGESGCGKSTLGKTLMRLHPATSGQVLVDGVDIVGMKPREYYKHYLPKIQMIFQDPYASLDPRMTVNQLIAEPLVTNKVIRNKKMLDKKVDELMELIGLASRVKNSYPHELDGGRRQRIGIARALSLEPEFIVCDEPVSALDVSIQAQVLNLLKDLQREKNLTYMFITHDMSVVKHISDEIAVMYLGQVIEKCSSKELFVQTLHPYSKALLSAIPVPSLNNKREKILLKGELTSPINPKPCCRFAPRCPYATEQCFATEPPLMPYKGQQDHLVACHRAEELN